MMVYNDITYCATPCDNMDCPRNIKHLRDEDIQMPVSQAFFDNCNEWFVIGEVE